MITDLPELVARNASWYDLPGRSGPLHGVLLSDLVRQEESSPLEKYHFKTLKPYRNRFFCRLVVNRLITIYN